MRRPVKHDAVQRDLAAAASSPPVAPAAAFASSRRCRPARTVEQRPLDDLRCNPQSGFISNPAFAVRRRPMIAVCSSRCTLISMRQVERVRHSRQSWKARNAARQAMQAAAAQRVHRVVGTKRFGISTPPHIAEDVVADAQRGGSSLSAGLPRPGVRARQYRGRRGKGTAASIPDRKGCGTGHRYPTDIRTRKVTRRNPPSVAAAGSACFPAGRRRARRWCGPGSATPQRPVSRCRR